MKNKDEVRMEPLTIAVRSILEHFLEVQYRAASRATGECANTVQEEILSVHLYSCSSATEAQTNHAT